MSQRSAAITFVMLADLLRDHNLPAVSQLARETLILVPLGLPLFAPLAFAERLGLGSWSAFAVGTILATITIGAWAGLDATNLRAAYQQQRPL